MPNLLKRRELLNNIENYQFEAKTSFKSILKEVEENDKIDSNHDFLDKQADVEKKVKKKRKENSFEIQKKKFERQMMEEAEKIRQDAKDEAEKIIDEAKKKADILKEEAKKEGYDCGYIKAEKDGYNDGYLKAQKTILEENEAFFSELKNIINELSFQKEEILKKYESDIKEVAIAVAEKVIQVSLKSSGEIIERMVLSATERLKAKEWAKIYISKNDAEIMIESDKDIIKTLSHISEHIKVVIMENEKQGTCIIEFPDEIIDASASTQLENIKEILSNS